METASFTWNAAPGRDIKKEKFSPWSPSPSKHSSKSAFILLKTTPNDLLLKLQMAFELEIIGVSCNYSFGVINHLEDHIELNFEIESNFFDKFQSDWELNLDWMRHEPSYGERPESMTKKQFSKVMLPSKKVTMLFKSNRSTQSRFVFDVTVSMEDHFSRAMRTMKIVKKMLDEKTEADFTIVCRPDEFTTGHGLEKSFKVHKSILACRCDVFKAMMGHNMKEARANELLLTDISFGALQQVINFLYNDNLQDLETHAMELLSAADKFLLVNMKKRIEKYVTDNFKLSTVLDVVLYAQLHNCEYLLESAVMFIVKHFDCIMHEPKWPDFVREQPDLLINILKKIPPCYSRRKLE